MIKKEGLKVKRAGQARAQPRRHPQPGASAQRDLRDRHEEGAHRGHRGEPARHPRDRGRRHQLRPRSHRLRDPRQRRRDPLGQPMCRIIAEAVIEGRARAAQARAPDTKTEEGKPEAPPVVELTPEERAQRDAEQQAARNAAAAAQREREARLQATWGNSRRGEGRHADAGTPTPRSPTDGASRLGAGSRTRGAAKRVTAKRRYTRRANRWLRSPPRRRSAAQGNRRRDDGLQEHARGGEGDLERRGLAPREGPRQGRQAVRPRSHRGRGRGDVDGTSVCIVELNCNTDFVAKGAEFTGTVPRSRSCRGRG